MVVLAEVHANRFINMPCKWNVIVYCLYIPCFQLPQCINYFTFTTFKQCLFCTDVLHTLNIILTTQQIQNCTSYLPLTAQLHPIGMFNRTEIPINLIVSLLTTSGNIDYWFNSVISYQWGTKHYHMETEAVCNDVYSQLWWQWMEIMTTRSTNNTIIICQWHNNDATDPMTETTLSPLNSGSYSYAKLHYTFTLSIKLDTND